MEDKQYKCPVCDSLSLLSAIDEDQATHINTEEGESLLNACCGIDKTANNKLVCITCGSHLPAISYFRYCRDLNE